ncbi:MAG: formylglycine-generating enzyme family protein [Phycisphaerae bacterium]|nr:formylglycine-generating enzyme family protein [Phycisphaerae bacterium]
MDATRGIGAKRGALCSRTRVAVLNLKNGAATGAVDRTAPAHGHLRACQVGLARVILLAGTLSWASPEAAFAAPRAVAVAGTEYDAPVSAAEADGYYQAVTEALSALGGIKVLERTQLKTVLDERDIALAFGPEDADARYASAAKPLDAEHVVVPAISKLENDYLLCLRLVSVASGATQGCTVHRTRLVSKFTQHAQRQVQELLGEQAATGESQPASDDEMAPVNLEALRHACVQAGTERLFPALWQRCQKLAKSTEPAVVPRLAHYYVTLLNLCARASAPPAGMVFIPGGYVTVNTTEGNRQLWVEPFFMDRCEVTVAEYSRFLLSVTAQGLQTQKLLSITRNDRDLNGPDLPVTGVTYEAAAAYAQAEGKALPTMLQWLRAACGNDEREYPCGGVDRLSGCRLKTAGLAIGPPGPAEDPTADIGNFGAMHMTGNVREWTCTWYDPNAYARTPADHPEEPADGTLKIVKGGSWRTDASAAACRAFEKLKPTEAFDDVGFRCVRPFFLGDGPDRRSASPLESR